MAACLIALGIHQQMAISTRASYAVGYGSCFSGTTILMGCVVAALSLDPRVGARGATVLRSRATLLLSLLLWANPYIESMQIGALSTYLHGLACALFVGWIYHNQEGVVVRLLEWRGLRYIGRISYGIYMYQGLLLTSSSARVPGRVWPLPTWLGFGLLCVIAPLSYHLFERRLIAAGKRFRQRPARVVLNAEGPDWIPDRADSAPSRIPVPSTATDARP